MIYKSPAPIYTRNKEDNEGLKMQKYQTLTIATIACLLLTLTTSTAIQTVNTQKAENTNPTATDTIIHSQNTITFAGYTWTVRNQNTSLPGPNMWSSSTTNVWVDSNGYLHLKITCSNGVWYCPEIESTQALGYGTYTFHTKSAIDNLDKNVVLGLFTYKDDSHEVDIEYAKWGSDNQPNTGFTVQPKPYIQDYNTKSFNTILTGAESTHIFTWRNNSVYFQTIQGNYNINTAPNENIIAAWQSQVSCDSIGAVVIINLWLFHGNAPSNGQLVEVVITGFEFNPL